MKLSPLSLLRVVLLTGSLFVGTDSFQGVPTVHPNLQSFADAQLGKLLKLRLDIGKTASERLCLQGPLCKFLDNVVPQTHLCPYPHLSTGGKALEVVEHGSVIDLSGLKTVPFENGCWDMSWIDGDRSGSLLFRFDLPVSVERNGVSLKPCQVHIQLPVWTKDGLAKAQELRRDFDRQRRALDVERQTAMQKFRSTANPFMKLWHYQQALQTMEKTHYIRGAGFAPENRDTLVLANGLLIPKMGTVWAKDHEYKGKNKFRRLGMASVSLFDPPKNAA